MINRVVDGNLSSCVFVEVPVTQGGSYHAVRAILPADIHSVVLIGGTRVGRAATAGCQYDYSDGFAIVGNKSHPGYQSAVDYRLKGGRWVRDWKIDGKLTVTGPSLKIRLAQMRTYRLTVT